MTFTTMLIRGVLSTVEKSLAPRVGAGEDDPVR